MTAVAAELKLACNSLDSAVRIGSKGYVSDYRHEDCCRRCRFLHSWRRGNKTARLVHQARSHDRSKTNRRASRTECRNEGREAEIEIKERALQEKAEGEKHLGKFRDELRERERVVDKRHEQAEQQAEDLRKQEKIVEGTQRRLAERLEATKQREGELSKLLDMQRQTLHDLSGLSRDEAVKRLLDTLDTELAKETGAAILKHQRHLQEVCDEKAREILLTALQRYASAHTAESTTSTVDIPSDEMKGRIIGREGRNIRASRRRAAST